MFQHIYSVYILMCTSVFVHTEYNLIFEDHFNSLNLSVWDHEVDTFGGGNNEFQFYTQDPANSFASDGILYIKPTLTVNNTHPLTGEKFGKEFLQDGVLDLKAMYGRCTSEKGRPGCMASGANGTIPPTMSARLRTYKKFFFKYGRLEVRAKMPIGDWIWPAVWMLPEDREYGRWPASGEIDLVESRGNRELFDLKENHSIGIDNMGATLHWGLRINETKIDRWNLTHKSQLNHERNFGDHFHLYEMEWSPNKFRFFVDKVEFFTFPNKTQEKGWGGFWKYGKENKPGWPKGTSNPWTDDSPLSPFDKPFHIILNVAVGGTNSYFPDHCVNGRDLAPKPWDNTESRVEGMRNFWNDVDNWYPTWTSEGPDRAMQVDYVKVFQWKDE